MGSMNQLNEENPVPCTAAGGIITLETSATRFLTFPRRSKMPSFGWAMSEYVSRLSTTSLLTITLSTGKITHCYPDATLLTKFPTTTAPSGFSREFLSGWNCTP